MCMYMQIFVYDSSMKVTFGVSRKPLPPIIEGQHVENELDQNMRFYRESELRQICKEARQLRLSATDITVAMQEVNLYLPQLKNIAVKVRELSKTTHPNFFFTNVLMITELFTFTFSTCKVKKIPKKMDRA